LAALSDGGGRHGGDANMVARPRGGDARGAWAEGRNIGRLAPATNGETSTGSRREALGFSFERSPVERRERRVRWEWRRKPAMVGVASRHWQRHGEEGR
jgi:hypothetical protein